jgi:hypothetical protein
MEAGVFHVPVSMEDCLACRGCFQLCSLDSAWQLGAGRRQSSSDRELWLGLASPVIAAATSRDRLQPHSMGTVRK